MQDFYREFGLRLHNARKRAGITQGELAQKVGMGRTSICNIEGGRQHLSLHVLPALAEALGVEECDLIPAREKRPEPADILASLPKDLPGEIKNLVSKFLGNAVNDKRGQLDES